jgi:hypothetical protein
VAAFAHPDDPSTLDEPLFTARLPGVDVGTPKTYNHRLLPAFFGAVILEDIELRGTHFDRLEVSAGPVPGSHPLANPFECRLETSSTDPWLLECHDFTPRNYHLPGGPPLAHLMAEFTCP